MECSSLAFYDKCILLVGPFLEAVVAFSLVRTFFKVVLGFEAELEKKCDFVRETFLLVAFRPETVELTNLVLLLDS